MKYIFLFLIVIHFSFYHGFAQVLEGHSKPNIILIMTDDQGWFDAGFNGNLSVRTPNLDKLAEKGIIFDRFYSASAVCSPTRASVITGRNPYRMGIPNANSGHIRKEEITIAELLKNEGYVTGHFGKWHLGTLTRKEKDANRGGQKEYDQHFAIPSDHGYDEFLCTESKVPTYDPMIRPAEFKSGETLRYGWSAIENKEESLPYKTSYWIGNEEKAAGDLSGDDTKIIMDQSIAFIENSISAKKSFFTTIWTHTPHLPVVADSLYKSKYHGFTNEQQLYYGCITALDDQIGRLWAELERLGIADNTMIWYCSDNGPERNTPGSAGKFRERKRSLHEGGLRTPAFVVWPNKFMGNQRVYFPAFTSDYLPTIVNLLNIDYPDDRPLDGIDLLPLLENQKQVRDNPMGFRYGNQISWVNQQFKLISKDNGNTYELYDLLNDRSESNNIIDRQKMVAGAMKKELEIWIVSVDDSYQGKDY